MWNLLLQFSGQSGTLLCVCAVNFDSGDAIWGGDNVKFKPRGRDVSVGYSGIEGGRGGKEISSVPENKFFCFKCVIVGAIKLVWWVGRAMVQVLVFPKKCSVEMLCVEAGSAISARSVMLNHCTPYLVGEGTRERVKRRVLSQEGPGGNLPSGGSKLAGEREGA